jgi:TPR repeat protein
MRYVLLLSLLFFLPSAQAQADKLEDGKAAYARGDMQTAYKLLRPLADNGNAEAEYEVGLMYETGAVGGSFDLAEALKWYRKAANHNSADAQSRTGFLYANGRGVKQDYTEALKWYRMAADRDYRGAQFEIGEIYKRKAREQKGDGASVKQDYREAYFWEALAARGQSGYLAKAKAKLIAQDHLSPAEKMEIDKRVADWQPTPAQAAVP